MKKIAVKSVLIVLLIVLLALLQTGKLKGPICGAIGIVVCYTLGIVIVLKFIFAIWRYTYAATDPVGYKLYQEFKKHQYVGSKKSKIKDYCSWENYFVKKYKKHFKKSKRNASISFLKKKLRGAKSTYDATKTITIPFATSVAILTFSIDDAKYPLRLKLVITGVTVIITAIIITWELLDSKYQIYFYEDCLELFKNN
ncbi:MAG TPA: hypothetical protein DCM49_02215 [Lachnospiraceae bacterium]|nr:hypothetical protein [Lachnospiraceae bacterium]